jgi:hypothetical protein
VAFSTATITSGPTPTADGPNTIVSWTSSSPDGTLFQLYVNGRLTWHGPQHWTVLPTASYRVYYQVGTVDFDEGDTDFSSSLPAIPGAGNRAFLTWNGGYWEGADIAGFHVYAGTTPGGAVSYTTPVAFVPIGIPGLSVGGYGEGPYGTTPYGSGSQKYEWTSDPLTNGTWHFGVKPIDSAGNEGTTLEVSGTITGEPATVPPNSSGLKLTYTYNATTHVATLNWLASPG